ncbi:MAG TPA: hypothetical protein VF934_09930 [Burkholderiales bacterium]|jgi:hypothetical protein
MLILRILGALLVITVGASVAVYLVTKDRRWLRFSWQILKFGLAIILIFLALLALERLATVI